MRAALYRGIRRIEMSEIERPAVGAEDVVVKVVNCGICGSDLHVFTGGLEQQPVVGGHEISGEIVEVGPAVSGFAPGDRVTVEPIVHCGHCKRCLSGQYNICDEYRLVGFGLHGGFAEYAVIPAYTCHRLPPNLSFECGAAIEPLAVAVHGVRLGQIGRGDSVVVLGGGAVGLLSVAAARAAGAHIVIASTRHEHQAAAAEELGATHVVFADDAAADETIDRLLGGRGADVVVETVGGSAATLQQALHIVRKGGRISLVGVFSSQQTIHPNLLVRREVSLIGAYCYNSSGSRRDFELALDLAASGAVPIGRLITHRFALSEIQQAFDTALDKSTRAIKVTVEIEP